MKKIVLNLGDEDFESAEQIAKMGNFESVEEYLNTVVRTVISEDGREFLDGKGEEEW